MSLPQQFLKKTSNILRTLRDMPMRRISLKTMLTNLLIFSYPKKKKFSLTVRLRTKHSDKRQRISLG